jgi:hypothetical protein
MQAWLLPRRDSPRPIREAGARQVSAVSGNQTDIVALALMLLNQRRLSCSEKLLLHSLQRQLSRPRRRAPLRAVDSAAAAFTVDSAAVDFMAVASVAVASTAVAFMAAAFTAGTQEAAAGAADMVLRSLAD